MMNVKRGRYGLSALLMVAIILISGCSKDEPKMLPGKFTRLLENQVLNSSILGRSIQYAVLLPADYDETEESYPVVYLLHGYGDDESAWYKNGGLEINVDRLITETVPMIYVMPQGFNTYYIDKYSGTFPYMEMFVDELVPQIDASFRTKAESSQRAVMGYSMGGYGALILPSLNPDVFSISIPLSMSFRTDEQYIAESQSSFDNQWAPNFGPSKGTSGSARLSNYFKAHSPFYFFNEEVLRDVKYLIDCGDDEESLIFTSNSLHSLMRNNDIDHEYRVRSGGHSFDYWRRSYPEALKFISNAVQGINHPAEPTPVTISTLISESEIEEVNVNGTNVHIVKPDDYETGTAEYPVLYFIHDSESGSYDQNMVKAFSLLREGMNTSKIVKSIVVEIPVNSESDNDFINDLVEHVDATYRTKDLRDNRVIMGNGAGGMNALLLASSTDLFSDCFIFSADLPEAAPAVSSVVFYYIDATDKSTSYKGYENLFTKIRTDGTDGYEYRVRQGAESFQAFLNGVAESYASLKESLNR